MVCVFHNWVGLAIAEPNQKPASIEIHNIHLQYVLPAGRDVGIGKKWEENSIGEMKNGWEYLKSSQMKLIMLIDELLIC